MSLAVLARKTKAKYTKSKNTDNNATQKVYNKEDHQIKVTTIRNNRQIPIQYKSNFVSKDNSPFNETTQYFMIKQMIHSIFK